MLKGLFGSGPGKLDAISGGLFDAGNAVIETGQVEYVAPRNELEATIQHCWQEVLGRSTLDPISVTADFFAEGGTSLQVRCAYPQGCEVC